ncbi:hypothetical protein [Aureibaculum conchae]|uniref:hypothetical protein n=1 Tax=Aureibaculum sp. 2308TA14-22 TaxID=3108392 RepID=UPI003396921E
MFDNVFYIAGSDGSGKTTFLLDLEKELLKKSDKITKVWIRSPKILSKPLMAYCRLIGLTKYTTINGVEYCKRNLYKSKFVSYTFPMLQLIDFNIKWYLHKRKLNSDQTLLLDRFVIDTLADLMVDTKRMDLHKTWIGKKFLELIPKNSKIVILKVDEEIVRVRKLDTLHDEHLGDKIKVFELLSNDLNIKLIKNNTEYKLVKDKVINYLLDEKNN